MESGGSGGGGGSVGIRGICVPEGKNGVGVGCVDSGVVLVFVVVVQVQLK